MPSTIGHLIWRVSLFSFAVLNYFLYLGLIVSNNAFFRKPTERAKNELLLARNKYWNLSQIVFNLHHRFFILRNGLQLHYFTNLATTNPSPRQSKTLLIFFHGFPDSSLLWRYITESALLQDNATLVAVDLPGTGGSDSFPCYGSTEVLEALTEFVVAMREKYIGRNHSEGEGAKVFIVGHDWGCAVTYRLASEAHCLADRFILTNGPHVPLAMANIDRITTASKKMLTTFLHAPTTNYHCLSKAIHAMMPLAYQVLLFGYIAAFQLPKPLVRYLGTLGDNSFARGAHKGQYGKDKSDYDPPHSMALSMGPGESECRTATNEEKPGVYGETVLARAKESGAWFLDFVAYYRDGLAFDKWEKSIDTLGAFHNIEVDNENSATGGRHIRRRRTSSASATLFSEPRVGSIKAPATVIWGKKDLAITEPICLDGIGDYLTRGSQVLVLPKTGHWTPLEKASRKTLQGILERLVQNGDLEKRDLQEVVKTTYPSALVTIDK